MPNPDPFLRPGLANPYDVELYASEAETGGTTTPVSVTATGTGTATVSFELIAQPGFVVGRRVLLPPKEPKRHQKRVQVRARGTAYVRMEVDASGSRRREEEELLLLVLV